MISSGNDTGSRIAFNVDDPLATEAIFRLNGLENNGLKKVVRVAAYNSFGSGPFSEPGVAIVFDQFAGRIVIVIGNLGLGLGGFKKCHFFTSTNSEISLIFS